MSDPQLEVLQRIWQSIKNLDRNLNIQIEGLERALGQRIDHTNSRLDQTNSGLDSSIALLEDLQSGTAESREMRMRTEILDVAKGNQGVAEVLKLHNARISRLESELGLVSAP